MLYVHLFNPSQNETFTLAAGVFELGRDPSPKTDCERLVVKDAFTSRDQLRVEQVAEHQVKLTNLGRAPVQFSDGSQIKTDEQRVQAIPVRLFFGQSTLDLAGRPPQTPDSVPDTEYATIQRSALSQTATAKPTLEELRSAPSADRLTQWFESLLQVQKAAAGSSEFYAEAARAVVEMVGLDRGVVLLYENGKWRTMATHSRSGEERSLYSERILNRVLRDRRTLFQRLASEEGSRSLQGIDAVVASPVLSEDDEVIGVVFGSRDLRSGHGTGIDTLEAQLLQVLAGMVSVGLARVEHEAAAVKIRAQFDQFFSSQLSQALERDTNLLAAQERLLSLLFVDLRGFSKISEQLGAERTYHLLSEILDCFTSTVMDQHEGVVIDYYGDGFAAMWNAPVDVPHHAEFAAQAGLGIMAQLPRLNDSLAKPLGVTIRVGIGIHTGQALVGNSGSSRRLKYGPRGHAVNLASRVEGANKLLGTSCLITDATRQLLPPKYLTRRLCRVQLYGLIEPVELFELQSPDAPADWRKLRTDYEAALGEIEAGNITACLQGCARIVAGSTTLDGPTRWLMSQANQRLSSGDLSPVHAFSFDSK